MRPEVFDVRDPAHDEDEIGATVADDLVGDIHVAALRVPRFGNPCREAAARLRPLECAHARSERWA